MNLKEVTLTNFRSYKGTTTFTPRPGTTFLLGVNNDNGYSSNGGGKTSLLSAIAWALYGELATGAAKDAVIHYGETEVAVEVKFEGLLVRRWKKRGKSEGVEFFSEELGGWVQEDLDQTQSKLNKCLGVSKELFYNAFWLDNASKTVQFLFKRPADRLATLQDLMGEGFFALAKKEATRRRAECEKALLSTKETIAYLQEQEVISKRKIVDLELEYEKKLAEVKGAADEMTAKASELQDLLEDLRLEQAMLDADYSTLVLSRTTPLETYVANCAVLESKERDLEEQLGVISRAKGNAVCPTCGRESSGSDIKEKRETLLRESVRIKNLLSVERKKKEKAQKLDKDIDKAKVALNEKEKEVKVCEISLDSLSRFTNKAAQDFLDKLSSLLKDEEDSLRACGKKLEELDRKKKDLEKEEPLYRFWEDGFGSKGIQNLLLDDIRGLLDQFTRNYLSHFSGEVLKVVYPKSDKGFEINVSYRDQETPVSNLSRGEVGRANMAVLLALRKMLLYMQKSKIDFIVLDDAISDLDESGSQSIVDLAEVLSKEVGHVFVTLPQDLATLRQDKVLRVSKENGVSRIV